MEILVVIFIVSYLIGSISGGIIVGKIKNIDILNEGSKASGATNVFRTIGIASAFVVLFIDVYKGYFSVKYLPQLFEFQNSFISQIIAGSGSIIGHVYPIYFKFKGGKGVGTALGTLIGIHGLSNVIFTALATWIISLLMTGYVGLSSIIGALSIPIYNIIELKTFNTITFYSIVILFFVIYTHKDNISRMIRGDENQFKKIMLKNLFK